MRLISLSLDASVLDKDTLLAKKTKEYGDMLDKYIVLVPAVRDQVFYLSDKVTVYGVGGFFRLFKLWKIYVLAKSIVKKEKCDIVTSQDPFELGLLAYVLKKRCKIAWNCQEHGDFFSQDYWRYESILNYFRYNLGKFLIKKCDSLRVVCERSRNFLSLKLGIDRDKIIKVPVLTEIEGEDTLREEGDEFVFLNLGRFVKQKNLPLLIQAFSQLKKSHPKARLKLIGRGPLKNELSEAIKDLHLEKEIEMMDWVDDISEYYKMSDAYVLSSNYEGWGRVIVEAAYYSLPVVMTEVGCAGEFIINNESGLVVEVDNKEALVDAMIRMMEDKEARKNMTIRAREQIKNLPDKNKTLSLYKYSWEKAVENSKK